mmetsp:Transcript_17908/g.53928  ORF Transcript_17908/g.53928 Transcript_17908/m.53928 type:complete len:229 (+) Transcript_17908:432-1118(+)
MGVQHFQCRRHHLRQQAVDEPHRLRLQICHDAMCGALPAVCRQLLGDAVAGLHQEGEIAADRSDPVCEHGQHVHRHPQPVATAQQGWHLPDIQAAEHPLCGASGGVLARQALQRQGHLHHGGRGRGSGHCDGERHGARRERGGDPGSIGGCGKQRHAADLLPLHAAEARPVVPRTPVQHSTIPGLVAPDDRAILGLLCGGAVAAGLPVDPGGDGHLRGQLHPGNRCEP